MEINEDSIMNEGETEDGGLLIVQEGRDNTGTLVYRLLEININGTVCLIETFSNSLSAMDAFLKHDTGAL